jgi:hypothetical protein
MTSLPKLTHAMREACAAAHATITESAHVKALLNGNGGHFVEVGYEFKGALFVALQSHGELQTSVRTKQRLLDTIFNTDVPLWKAIHDIFAATHVANVAHLLPTSRATSDTATYNIRINTAPTAPHVDATSMEDAVSVMSITPVASSTPRYTHHAPDEMALLAELNVLPCEHGAWAAQLNYLDMANLRGWTTLNGLMALSSTLPNKDESVVPFAEVGFVTTMVGPVPHRGGFAHSPRAILSIYTPTGPCAKRYSDQQHYLSVFLLDMVLIRLFLCVLTRDIQYGDNVSPLFGQKPLVEAAVKAASAHFLENKIAFASADAVDDTTMTTHGARILAAIMLEHRRASVIGGSADWGLPPWAQREVDATSGMQEAINTHLSLLRKKRKR